MICEDCNGPKSVFTSHTHTIKHQIDFEHRHWKVYRKKREEKHSIHTNGSFINKCACDICNVSYKIKINFIQLITLGGNGMRVLWVGTQPTCTNQWIE